MIFRAPKVPQIKMEDRSPFDMGTKNWAPAHGLHSTVKISDSARRSQLLRAGHHRAWHLILICHFKLLEERWAKLAQLFAFYWDLTRNKFSFLPSLVPLRSPLFSSNFHVGGHFGFSKTLRKILWNIGWDRGQWVNWMEGSQSPGSETIHHITYRQGGDIGVLQKLVLISHINAGKWILLSGIINWPNHPPHCSATPGRFGQPQRPRLMRKSMSKSCT